MKAIIPAPSVNGFYLLWLLKVLQPHLLNMVSTAAHGTRKLETSRLENLIIPLLPIEKQDNFSEKVMEMQSIQSQQFAATAKAEATFDALLARFFTNPFTEMDAA